MINKHFYLSSLEKSSAFHHSTDVETVLPTVNNKIFSAVVSNVIRPFWLTDGSLITLYVFSRGPSSVGSFGAELHNIRYDT